MADIWFDVDIAIAEAPVNLMPLIDDTDFKTIEAAVVYNAAGMALIWHFVTTLGVMTETAVTPTTAGVHDWTDQGTSGIYALEIPASAGTINNATEGFGWFTGVATGVLPWRGPVIGFRAAAINDALIDTDTLLKAADVGMHYKSTISTLNSQTSFDMGDAFASNDVANGMVAVITDAGNSANFHMTRVTDIDAANNRILTNDGPAGWVIATTDTVRLFGLPHPNPVVAAELATFGVATKTNVRNNAQILGRKDADAISGLATEIGEFNENFGGGGGSFLMSSDSIEATGDNLATVDTEVGVIDGEVALLQTDLDTLTAGVTLAAGAITNASLAGNMEIVFETDFATNYNVTRNAWATNTQDLIGTGAWNTVVPDAAGTAATPAEVATALTDIHLDHLMAAAAADVIVDGSVIAHMVSATEDWSTFVPSTDALQALRDRGDAAWTTGAGANPFVLQNTTIATLASQVSFTLTAGSADNDVYNGMLAIVEDAATSTQKAIGVISDYVGSSKTITLREDPGIFVMAASDTIDIVAVSPDVLDILADTAELQTDDYPTTIAALQTDLDTLTAGVTLAADAITSAKIADNAFLAVNFAASSLNGKGDWNTVTPDAVGVAATQAEVATECAAAISAVNLDHFVGTASGIPALPAGTYLDLLQDDGTAIYSRTTDSLQAIRDHATTIKSETSTIAGDVVNIDGIVPAAPGDLMGLAADAITSAKIADNAFLAINFAASSLNGKGDWNTVTPDAAGTAATPADVNAQVLDVMNVDVFGEPGQGAPGVSISMFAKINFLYKAWRNKSFQNATEYRLYADDTTTIDQKATVSDDATDAIKGEVGTGA